MARSTHRRNPRRALGVGKPSRHLGAQAAFGLGGSRPSPRLLVEVIASAFSNGLSLHSSLGGKDVYCPPPGLNGHKIMSAFAQFLEENPDMAERPYGDAMAASLSRAFPCQTL